VLSQWIPQGRTIRRYDLPYDTHRSAALLRHLSHLRHRIFARYVWCGSVHDVGRPTREWDEVAGSTLARCAVERTMPLFGASTLLSD